jgi:predicted methyltransferase
MARNTLLRCLGAAAAALVITSTPAVAAEDAALQRAITGEHRSEASQARDQFRHPYETLTFFGIRPDMTVVEIWPGAGWYTEILAPYLREQGKLYAAHFDPAGGPEYFARLREQFEQKLAAEPELYDRVELVAFAPHKATSGIADESADLVVTFRNVHNWYMRGGGEERTVAAFREFHRMLRPGGTLGVVDHRLAKERPVDDQEASGYMNEEFVIRAAKKAGFELAGKSEINANPRDHGDHPKGVWTLPPSLAAGDENRDAYLQIGESDRMTLKFVKAAASN